MVSRALAGDRSVPSEALIFIAKELGDYELIHPELRVGDSERLGTRRGSDPSDSVPRDLAEYLLERGKADGVQKEDIGTLARASFLEERGKPRSPDFYRGILATIRLTRPGPGARGKGG